MEKNERLQTVVTQERKTIPLLLGAPQTVRRDEKTHTAPKPQAFGREKGTSSGNGKTP